MNLKDLFEDVVSRSEKIKNEVLSEVLNSDLVNQIVTSKNFEKAVSKVIRTTSDMRKVVQSQIHNVFRAMGVPTKGKLSVIQSKLAELEKQIDRFGSKSISIKKFSSAVKKGARKAASKTVKAAKGKAKPKKKSKRK